jgi:hypothetical protein
MSKEGCDSQKIVVFFVLAMAIGVGAGFGPFSANSGAIAENNIKVVANQE